MHSALHFFPQAPLSRIAWGSFPYLYTINDDLGDGSLSLYSVTKDQHGNAKMSEVAQKEVGGGTSLQPVKSKTENHKCIAGTLDGNVELYSFGEKIVSYHLATHNGPVSALSINYSNETCISGGEDGNIHVISLGEGYPVQKSFHTDGMPIYNLSFSTESTEFISTSTKLSLWDTRTSNFSVASTPQQAVSLVGLANDHNQPWCVATSSVDGVIGLWDLRKLSESIQKISYSPASVWTVKFDPMDSSYLLSCGNDGVLLSWNIQKSNPDVQVVYRGAFGLVDMSVESIRGDVAVCSGHHAVMCFLGQAF
eukprot:gb/GECH01011889.1/.p1 GENE.gb/GECH01011889.1/~~gb/GECH01011889.1/.p1  ORF type:complete len:309 (+),score=38.65 gb/GECH01011889.1/:1-927(+)